MFNRETLIGTAVGLCVGLLAGYSFGSKSAPPLVVPSPVAAAPGTPQGLFFDGVPPTGVPAAPPPAPAAPSAEAAAQAFAAEQAVAANPKDVKAHIALGNFYFDSHQHQKSVDAYAKALALEPNNPDVLTDQGVMYRALKAYAKAEANFLKAQKLNPKHVQSLFNLGVVYAHDLNAPAKAIKAFSGVIDLAPASQQAVDAGKALEALKAAPKG
jgi:cytochrome c-type biogenesis protein CcmH/NrfG